jgi:hypothetical protein
MVVDEDGDHGGETSRINSENVEANEEKAGASSWTLVSLERIAMPSKHIYS